ncbi:MAG: ABC transporter permease [Halobacteriales archaeon]|nr:ABC transporter permease [Halobacteriales archaeon]
MSTDLELDRGGADWTVLGDGQGHRLALGGLGLAGFLAVWWLAAIPTPDFVLPTPTAVAETFVSELRSGAMLTAVQNSVIHWVPGAIIGTALGVGFGVALAWSPVADDTGAPLVRLLRPVPPLALIGFAIAWFGLNHAGAAFIIAAGAFWINFYAAYGGVESVPPEFVEVAESLGVHSSLGLIRKVVLPSAAPQILTGIRTAVGRSWMLVIAAELISVPGVGQEIIAASNNLATDVVIAYILVMSLFYLVVDSGFRAVQQNLLQWRA